MNNYVKVVIANGTFGYFLYKAITQLQPNNYIPAVCFTVGLFSFMSVISSVSVMMYSKLEPEDQIKLLKVMIGNRLDTVTRFINKILDAGITVIFFYFGWWITGLMYLGYFLGNHYINHFADIAIGVINGKEE